MRFLALSTRYYIHRTLFYLTTPIFAVLFYLYGDNAEHFDQIYIAALSVSCIFCWSDKDTLGALLILLGYWGISRLLYMAPDTLLFWVLIYGGCLGISAYYFRYLTAKVVFIITLYSIAAEAFWAFNNYPFKPEIHYYIGLLSITVWLLQLLFNRVFIAYQYLGYVSGKTALDTHVSWILHVYFWLVLAVVLEYFLRHLAGYREIVTIYYLYPPASNVIAAITLMVIYMHYFYYQSKKHIKV